uniref:N-acetyltransferase domain-containing protein n=1 Tax=Leersia perrieri TaxID=77586 RepID=A0A0D9VCZ1_9ORYZ
MGEDQEKMSSEKMMMIRVREFIMEKDLPAVEELERLSGDLAAAAGGGANGKKKNTNKKGISLYVEQIGDPFARIRHAPDHVILVAEFGEEEKVVGVIKACVRMVSRSSSKTTKTMMNKYVKVACLLGLRVSPSHRRQGIATELVRHAESWCTSRGATYATVATTASNAASLSLFRGRFGYAPFRRPLFLGHPVHRHRARLPRHHRVLHLPPPLAAAAYGALLLSPPSPRHDAAAGRAEFVPSDLPSLLAHKLTRGTYLAVERDGVATASFAMVSVYDATRTLSFRVGGATRMLRASLAAARAIDRAAPWLRVPSVPDVFRPFGAYLLYGVHVSGPAGPSLLRTLCRHAHNVARKNPACAVVAADIGPDDPAAAAVPHWPKFSCDEDVWCIKKLNASDDDGGGDGDDEWTAATAPGVLFVDPREF